MVVACNGDPPQRRGQLFYNIANMFYTYVLQSQKNSRYYIGSTNNLERRFKEHNKDHGGK